MRNLTGATIDRPIGQPKWIDDQRLVVDVARGFPTSAGDRRPRRQAVPLDGLDVNPSAFDRAAERHARLCRRNGRKCAGAVDEDAVRRARR